MRRALALASLFAVAIPAGPALAQETDVGETAETAERFSMPLLVAPGMPNPAGGFTVRMNGAFMGVVSPASTGLTGEMFVGITPQLGLNLRTGFTQTGPTLGAGAWSDLSIEGQYAVMQTADKAAGLSLVGAGVLPGGVGGHNIGAVSPAVGIRGQATMGPIQTHVNTLYRPGPGNVEYGLSGVLQISEQLAGGIDVLGAMPVLGGAMSLGIAPSVVFRLTPGLRVGAGYVLPIQGTPPQSGQILGHLQLGM